MAVELDLAVRRLSWMQKVLAMPGRHRLLLAVLNQEVVVHHEVKISRK